MANRRMRRGKYFWGTFLSFGKRNLCERLDINRARGPRCKACGGRVEPSSDQAERTATARAEQAEQEAKHKTP